jgi:hypothetical protein
MFLMKKLLMLTFLLILLSLTLSVQSVKGYTNIAYGFSITPPAGWTEYHDPAVVVAFMDLDKVGLIEVYVRDTSKSLTNYVASIKDAEQKAHSSYNIISENTKKIGELTCYELVAEYTDNGTTWKRQQEYFAENNKVYIINCQADASVYDSYYEEFQSSSQTFRLIDLPTYDQVIFNNACTVRPFTLNYVDVFIDVSKPIVVTGSVQGASNNFFVFDHDGFDAFRQNGADYTLTGYGDGIIWIGPPGTMTADEYFKKVYGAYVFAYQVNNYNFDFVPPQSGNYYFVFDSVGGNLGTQDQVNLNLVSKLTLTDDTKTTATPSQASQNSISYQDFLIVGLVAIVIILTTVILLLRRSNKQGRMPQTASVNKEKSV